MKKEIYESFVIENASHEAAERLRNYFARNEGKGYEEDQGTASNPCFDARYLYDPDTQKLEVTPVRLMPNLKPTRLKHIIEHIMSPANDILSSCEYGPTPTPNACAVYDWTVIFIDNQSGSPLYYSDIESKTDHGTILKEIDPVPVGLAISEGDQPDGVVQNEAGKDSGFGCQGTAVWQLADGVTYLTVTYHVNTSSTVSASAGLSGMNAKNYKVEYNKHQNYDAGNVCEYLYVYVTISKNQ